MSVEKIIGALGIVFGTLILFGIVFQWDLTVTLCAIAIFSTLYYLILSKNTYAIIGGFVFILSLSLYILTYFNTGFSLRFGLGKVEFPAISTIVLLIIIFGIVLGYALSK